MEAEASRWRGTPYASGGRAIGGGVDCVGLVCGVWDGLMGLSKPTAVPASVFAGGSYKGVLAELSRVYRFELVRPARSGGAWGWSSSCQAGDAVLCSSWGWAGGRVAASGGGVSLSGSERYHVLLVGAGSRLWHANEPMGVERVGWQVVGPLARLALRPVAVREAIEGGLEARR